MKTATCTRVHGLINDIRDDGDWNVVNEFLRGGDSPI